MKKKTDEAVIEMTIKGRSPALRHVTRTHRVDLDWLFERIRDDPGIHIKFIGTKYQIADMLTKGQFTGEQWGFLVRLCQLVDTGIQPPKPTLPKPQPTPVGKVPVISCSHVEGEAEEGPHAGSEDPEQGGETKAETSRTGAP